MRNDEHTVAILRLEEAAQKAIREMRSASQTQLLSAAIKVIHAHNLLNEFIEAFAQETAPKNTP